ncbi:MAG: lysylphosphatidylglycerol synthase domain-containing protein [Polyangiales bacterium]
MKLPHRRWVTAVATVTLLAVALYALRRALAETSLADIEAAAARISRRDLALAGVLTVGSYLALALYDLLALRLVDRRVPVRRAALTAFIAYAFANTLGAPSLSGGSVRLRAYLADGLTALQVATLQALCTLTFVLGATWITGLAMLLDPPHAAAALHLSPRGVQALGATLVGAVVASALVARVRRTLRVGRWSVTLPSMRYVLAQVFVSSLDMCLAASCLYVLLPGVPAQSFAPFLAVFVLALAAGVVSSVPGGLGVFESTLVLLLPEASAPELLGAVLVYRFIYYLAPFVLAVVLFVGRELRSPRAA